MWIRSQDAGPKNPAVLIWTRHACDFTYNLQLIVMGSVLNCSQNETLLMKSFVSVLIGIMAILTGCPPDVAVDFRHKSLVPTMQTGTGPIVE